MLLCILYDAVLKCADLKLPKNMYYFRMPCMCENFCVKPTGPKLQTSVVIYMSRAYTNTATRACKFPQNCQSNQRNDFIFKGKKSWMIKKIKVKSYLKTFTSQHIYLWAPPESINDRRILIIHVLHDAVFFAFAFAFKSSM